MGNKVLISYGYEHKVGPYLEAVRSAGLEPFLHKADTAITLDQVEGLLLTGGSDVDPARYGQSVNSETQDIDPVRDEIECNLIEAALSKDVPVLAICRGMQILNVALGGTLLQHVESGRHRPEISDKSAPVHEVEIEPGTLLNEIAGTRRMQVNSRHHQAIARLGERLRIAATDPEDGMIEAVECSDKRFVLGVQWHPEDQIAKQPEQLRLFHAFARALEYVSR